MEKIIKCEKCNKYFTKMGIYGHKNKKIPCNIIQIKIKKRKNRLIKCAYCNQMIHSNGMKAHLNASIKCYMNIKSVLSNRIIKKKYLKTHKKRLSSKNYENISQIIKSSQVINENMINCDCNNDKSNVVLHMRSCDKFKSSVMKMNKEINNKIFNILK